MSSREISRLIKAYEGLGLCCERTAQALTQNSSRIQVPELDPARMAENANAAEAMGPVITDLEALLLLLKQNQLLLAASAHQGLLRVLVFVRAHARIDPRLPQPFPHLVEYFAKTKPTQEQKQARKQKALAKKNTPPKSEPAAPPTSPSEP